MRTITVSVCLLAAVVVAFMYQAQILRFFGFTTCGEGTERDSESGMCIPIEERNHPEFFDISTIDTIVLNLQDVPGGRIDITRDNSSAQPFSGSFRTANPTVEGTVMILHDRRTYIPATGDVVLAYAIDYGGSGYFLSVGLFSIEGNSMLVMKDSHLVGDRVLIDGVAYPGGEPIHITIDYRDRMPNEPMAALPTVPKRMTIDIRAHTFGEPMIETLNNSTTYKDLIRVSIPQTNEEILSPVRITGEARGPWYFEATFPITIVDWDGVIIGEGYAEATSDWMTAEYVPFEGTVIFTVPHDTPYRRGALILHKSNASGLPEHDDAFEIPVRFE